MVPCREEKMSPYEIMLSESQERMLIVLENGKEEKAKKIFDKWDLDFAIIGKTTNSKKIELYFDDKKVCDIPVDFLAENAPVYDRKWKKIKLPQSIKFKKQEFKSLKIENCLRKLLSHQILKYQDHHKEHAQSQHVAFVHQINLNHVHQQLYLDHREDHRQNPEDMPSVQRFLRVRRRFHCSGQQTQYYPEECRRLKTYLAGPGQYVAFHWIFCFQVGKI